MTPNTSPPPSIWMPRPSYKVNDNFTVDFQAINLTGPGSVLSISTPKSVSGSWSYYPTGREYFMGVRYNY